MPTSIFEGKVYHSRTKCVSSPVEHSFSYSVWMALIDLKQVEEHREAIPSSFICSFDPNKVALTKWRRSDHFGKNENLSVDVKELVNLRTGIEQIDRIELLTNLSFFGAYNFNPVSVYYCYQQKQKDEEEDRLVAVVLEVSNTPWLDKRMYVLKFDQDKTLNMKYEVCWEKDFHVSPFMDVSHYYDWILHPLRNNDQKLSISAISKRRDLKSAEVKWDTPHVHGGEPIKLTDSSSIEDLPTTFVVKLDLRRVPWDHVTSTILTNPIMPLAAVLWIHVEAFKVWYKGVNYVNPPVDSRELGFKDAIVHLIVFTLATLVKYGIILPIQLLRKVITQLAFRLSTGSAG
jgi:DUF1365 family protein